ncbi:putative LPS assembly protein LptD [Hymenobacter gelipurpurascens]|uniref:putative LPS assembly protein LptD n=1 Tax=Hymenobacter gelipurpurascens TaxID=89968 RepID=UPI00112FEAB3|nr:putative LPS assembly protein LptD [Hymenobacter gelipurpurascens]
MFHLILYAPGRWPRLLTLLLPLLLSLLGARTGLAQQRPRTTSVPTDVRPAPRVLNPPKPNAPVRTDTVGLVSGSPDSLNVAAGGRKGAVETTVKYKAKDSIRFEVQNKKAILYDKANVDYGDMNIQSARITVDYNTNVVTAEGRKDSTGKLVDRPVFKDGGSTYQANRIDYNTKSKRGRITDVVTNMGEGYIHAETIKKNDRNELFGVRGRYTTCNLEDPHFYINASKMKVIPGEKVVTGPFNLVIGDIPTPLGFLFGYFPTPKTNQRASGLIIPTFGQAADRGFFLRNGGYYWAANDHIGVRLTGDIYSGNADVFGGWRGTAEVQYITRYRYSGLLSFNYSSQPTTQILSSTDVNTNPQYNVPRSSKNFALAWNHTPVARPNGGRFSANVNVSSSNYYRQNSYNQRLYLQPAFSSTISYSKQIRNSPINYALQLSQTQNTQSGTMNFTLPDVTVGVARQYLYDLVGLEPQGKFYEQLAVAYTFVGQNRISNSIPQTLLNSGAIPVLGGSRETAVLPVKLDNLAKLLRNSQTGVQHQFQITLGNYTLLKHFNLNPSISYNEVWYFKSLDYSYNSTARAVRIDTVAGFNRLNSYSGGLNLSTNFYGTINRKGTRKIQALRHKVTPSLSWQYSPDNRASNRAFAITELGDLRDPATGRVFLNDPSLKGQSYQSAQLLPRYNGFLFGVPSTTKVSAINFSLQNSVEMKVRNNEDTTGTTPFNKVSLIDGLDFNIGYNFADSVFNLSPLGIVFRTQVARKLNLLVNSNLEFYQQDSTRRLINKFLWQQDKKKLARLASASLTMSYQFNPSTGDRKSAIKRPVAPANDPSLGSPTRLDPYEDYVDFEIPWDLSTNLTATYANQGPLPARFNRPRNSPYTAVSLNLNGSVKLTETLRFGFSTNYDFVNKNPAFTSLDIFKDLHCWQINGNWRPFGPTRGYFVTIAAKSALLQDLKLSRNRTFLNY